MTYVKTKTHSSLARFNKIQRSRMAAEDEAYNP